MPWKLTDEGALVKDTEGNPIWIEDGGEEKSVDYIKMTTAMAKANKEAAERRQLINEYEVKIKPLEGIEDIGKFIADAKKNAETVANMDKDRKGIEEATRLRIENAITPLQKQIQDLEAKNGEIINRYHNALIDSQFGTSKYVNDELVNPAMVKELFGRYFYVNNDGRIIGKDSAGNEIYDEKGVAEFDTALRKLVSASPYKTFVTKSTESNGSGAKQSTNDIPKSVDLTQLSSAQKIALGLKKQKWG